MSARSRPLLHVFAVRFSVRFRRPLAIGPEPQLLLLYSFLRLTFPFIEEKTFPVPAAGRSLGFRRLS